MTVSKRALRATQQNAQPSRSDKAGSAGDKEGLRPLRACVETPVCCRYVITWEDNTFVEAPLQFLRARKTVTASTVEPTPGTETNLTYHFHLGSSMDFQERLNTNSKY
ncbi:hypothetical protein J6590_024588 [Homalodisca vitripennis]|nr:hypothetical protein J6590_024588 [Homalodisca vitripennis]